MARTAGGGCQSPGAPQAVLPALVVVVRNDAAANLPMTRATHSQVNHALQFHEPAIVRCSGIGLEMGGGGEAAKAAAAIGGLLVEGRSCEVTTPTSLTGPGTPPHYRCIRCDQ